MLLLMGGLIVWKLAGSDEKPTAIPPAIPKQTAAPVEAPPPPPEPEELDAGSDAETEPKKKVVRKSSGGCSGNCAGTASARLQSAVAGKAGQARGCYERALRQNPTLEGRLTVGLRIGPGGQVCSAHINSNSLGDPGVASCVLQMFRAGTFPAPKGGCVDMAVPMNFVPKR